jgi:type IV pilus assembly protein PilB
VGEIRDEETAEIAVNAATTGHLVFTTLHTIDASASIARLIDLGVGPRQFADALSLIIAQRLIRLICQSCIEEYNPTEEELARLDMGTGWHPEVLKRGRGCPVCNGTGYFRRMGLFEYLEPSDRLRGAIEAGKLSTSEIREMAVAAGMRTMRNEAIALLTKGVITVEETLRTTK